MKGLDMKGVCMCQALLEIMEPEINKIKEQTIKETAYKEARENAANMLKSGKFSPEEIKKYIPRLSVEEIKTLAEGLCLNADLNH